MKEKTSAEWIELYLANGDVCAEVIQTTQDALRHPQVVATDLVVEFDDPRVGPMLQIGPLAKIPGAAAQVETPAPQPGADTEQVLATDVLPVTLPTPTRDDLAGPLAGITIIEAALLRDTVRDGAARRARRSGHQDRARPG